jgi:uncharacterized protein YecE (DUF72 family)
MPAADQVEDRSMMIMHALVHIGTAGWHLPKVLVNATDGSALQRYAEHFNAVEVNSTHYTCHKEATFHRWAASVPADFRFAVKMHRDITHIQRLTKVGPIQEFLQEVSALGDRLGALLVQLPPKLAWSEAHGDVLEAVREVYTGPIVLEPRNPSWSNAAVIRRLLSVGMSVVAADPPLITSQLGPLGDPATSYFRLHGAPRMYWSAYDKDSLRTVVTAVRRSLGTKGRVWVMFDNTASGQAALNALHLKEMLP